MTTQVLPSGAVVAGRYRILARLGEGGMGAVYRATQEPLGREVALKVMAASLAQDAGAIERFQREAKASSALQHPNIVTVYDFGTDADGSFFLAMELIPGKGLDGLIEHGPLDWRRGVTILRGICAALTEAHAKGIVHRDLKPANVIVTSTTTHTDVAKVVDFGIAKLKDTGNKSLTMTGAVVGTPGYVAPELFHGHEPTSQADLYALGVMAFDVLCGRAPFKGNTAAELLKQHLFDPPPAPSSVIGGLPPALDALVLALLAKDPNARPRSARDVDIALAAIEGGAASVAVPSLGPAMATEMALSGSTGVQYGRMPSSTSQPTPTTGTLPSSSSSQLMMTPPPQSGGLKIALAALGAIVIVLVAVVVVVVVKMNREDRREDRQARNDPPPVVAAVPTPTPTPTPEPTPEPTPTPTPTPVATTTTTTPEPTEPEKPKKKLTAKERLKEAAEERKREAEERKKEKERLMARLNRDDDEPSAQTAQTTSEPKTPTSNQRAFLGTFPDGKYTGHGVRVLNLASGSPAHRAAILPGDVLLAIDNDEVDSVPGLAVAMAKHHPGDRVRVTFARAGGKQSVQVTLTAPPSR